MKAFKGTTHALVIGIAKASALILASLTVGFGVGAGMTLGAWWLLS